MMGTYEVCRRWWFPFVVEVWEQTGEGEHFSRGHYTAWIRRGIFLRRSTAEQFVKWLDIRKAWQIP
jgi:hypothetical protein